jgi:hypothetical protein
MLLLNLLYSFLILCFILQCRNYNHYRVKHQKKFNEAVTYLNSDVCIDPITRADLGTFNLCEKATLIASENPSSAAFYQILNDWHPCGHSRCEGLSDWCITNLHWFVFSIVGIGMLIYIKWIDYQRDIMFTKMRLPLSLASVAKKD